MKSNDALRDLITRRQKGPVVGNFSTLTKGTKTMLDVARSLAAAKRITVQPKECYANALYTLLCHREYRSAWYVEGFANTHNGGGPFEHGWVELAEGSIIDPTLAVLGHTNVTYFPAIKLNYEQALRLVETSALVPSMLWHKSVHNHTAYLKAHQDAHAAAGIKVTQPPFW
jgi:hypothetical protein